MDLSPNLTIFPMWGIFFASFLVLHFLVFKPTLKILAVRAKGTVGMQKDAVYFTEQAEIKLKEYEALMTEARQVARENRDATLKKAQTEQKQIIGQAREEAERTISSAKGEISKQSREARAGLKTESESLAAQMVAKLMERKVA